MSQSAVRVADRCAEIKATKKKPAMLQPRTGCNRPIRIARAGLEASAFALQPFDLNQARMGFKPRVRLFLQTTDGIEPRCSRTRCAGPKVLTY
jgi:hypothetical protein